MVQSIPFIQQYKEIFRKERYKSETTREAPTNIGTALKTIVANFAQFKEDPTSTTEDGVDVNKVDKALKSVGIQLLDSTGQMRDLGDVIDELGMQWEHLDRNTRSYLATMIAGQMTRSSRKKFLIAGKPLSFKY